MREPREVAGVGRDQIQRPQRLGRLGRGLDVCDPAGIQGRRGPDDDKERDQIGDAHADNGIGSARKAAVFVRLAMIRLMLRRAAKD